MIREFYSEIELCVDGSFLYLQYDPDVKDEEYPFTLVSYGDAEEENEPTAITLNMEMLKGLVKAAEKLLTQFE